MAEIPATPVDGNMRAVVVPTVADKNAPKLTELNGASVKDLSCYINTWDESLDESVIDDQRLCDREDREQPGRKKRGLSLTYIDNTNSPNEADANEAVETLAEGATYYIVERRGIPYETPFAADQKVSVWPIKGGAQQKVAPEANSTFKRTSKQYVTSPVAVDVTVTA